MRINNFWVVIDPVPASEPIDILWEATPTEFVMWARGGIPSEGNRHPAFYLTSGWAEAEADARARMAAR